jgi:hypothetical protein
MNGSVLDPHAHKQTSINELLKPTTSSSVIVDDLPHQSSSYPNGHYAQSMTCTQPPMQSRPCRRDTSGTAYKNNPASWGEVDHDILSPRSFALGAVPSQNAHQAHAYLPRTHEDGFSKPSVWSSPAGRMDAYGSPTITQSSYQAERTCECSLLNPLGLFVHLQRQRSQTILQL